MSSSYRLLFVIAIAFVTLSTASASAGTYTVRQCDYAAGIGHHDFQWQAAGSPALVPHGGSGCGEFGLSARNGAPGTEQTYPSGGYGGWFAYAPVGTVFTRFSGAFGTLAGCCINGLATYAEATEQANGAGGRSYLFQGNLGNQTWSAPSGVAGPVGRSWDASTSGFAARRVGFHVRCGPGFSCPQGPAGDLRVRARSFDFTLRDDVRPSVGQLGGTLLSGSWLRGSHTLSFAAHDVGGGLVGVGATFDRGAALASPSACTTAGGRYAKLQPCPLERSGSWNVDTTGLPDGTRTLTVHAADVGGETAEWVRKVAVDNSAPASPLSPSVIGGSGWRRANGFTLRWTAPGGQHAPIVKARHSACPTDGGQCVHGERALGALSDTGPIDLPRGGEWDARVWLEDAAGNSDAGLASPPQRLRFDPDPPVLTFLPFAPEAPARASVQVEDLSGVVAGEIELRRRGADTWQALPTARSGTRLVADIDDARRRGVYVLRAWAVDAAGNHTTLHGPERTLPIRQRTRLRASAVRRVARYGSLAIVRGRLATVAGRPLAARSVDVSLVSRDRTVRLPAISTDARGRLVLALRARRSATVKLQFAGDGALLPSARHLAVRVPAPVTIAASHRIASGGQRVLLHGRVRGGAIPRRGKLVEIQAHFRGRWRTISTIHSRRSGHWRFGYAFQATGRVARYRLRARVPVEARYPFARGKSRAIRVTVRAR